MQPHILIVDDEPSIRLVLKTQLEKAGHSVSTCTNGEEAVEWLSNQPAQLVISDLRMPGLDGMSLLRWTRQNLPGLPVILITAFGTIDSAVEAVKQGAFDYITKPFEKEELLNAVDKALATVHAGIHKVQSHDGDAFDLIRKAPSTEALWSTLERIAPTPSSVLVRGDAGTGTSLVAKAIHHLSPRSSGPFIEVSCGAIPLHLMDAELFGSALQPGMPPKPGRVELADGGTLFLDDVHALPQDVQLKLVRFLQTGQLVDPRSGAAHPVDVRLVVATDRDMSAEVSSGQFRSDLFYKLNVMPLTLVPLRERLEDLPALCDVMLEQINQRYSRRVSGIQDDALDMLKGHSWPGNLSELETTLERAILLTDNQELTAEDLQPPSGASAEPVTVGQGGEQLGLKDYLRMHTARLERHRIRHALNQEAGNVTRAARRLGISRRSLQTKMKEYGLRER